MKYRIVSLHYTRKKKITKQLRAKRRSSSRHLTVLPPVASKKIYHEYIDLGLLFELGQLPEAKKKRIKKHRIKSAAKKIRQGVLIFSEKMKQRSAAKARRPERLAFFGGVFLAASVVCALCAAGVLAKLFFPYVRSFVPVSVPMLVGETIERAESEAYGFELLVTYENSADVEAGVVISQRPEAGVTRKIFKNGEPCYITVTVSAGKERYTVDDLVGADGRLALLALYNEGVSVKEEYVYSDSVPEGNVISSSPSAGAVLYEGETLTVRISLGKETVFVIVPNLYGLNEAQAIGLLAEKGLQLGAVTYSPDEEGAGKIIRQQYSPYEKVALGSTVDVTVSLGSQTHQKTVPDLYGLTADEAAKKLSEFGLVLGNIYPVSSGAPNGTVVAQTPVAGTPITSSITAVDVYISS